ncbi:hypothetical protein [Paraburkholderia caffeinilytica]|uniref:hypothetical protein n=1 Tax=Paraburkholderia caffeinilytica TaxID=1761016 RepID=UPI003DA1C0BE
MIRIAMHPGIDVIQNIAVDAVSRHEPDTSARFDASTPDARRQQLHRRLIELLPLLPDIRRLPFNFSGSRRTPDINGNNLRIKCSPVTCAAFPFGAQR